MKRATLMLAVLSVCGMASAALQVQTTNSAPFLAPNGTEVVQVSINVVGSGVGGDVLGAWDGRFDGVMYQIRAAGFFATPTLSVGDPGETLANYMTAAEIAADSHMMFQTSELTVAQSPYENRNSTTSLGTTLSGAAKPPDFPANGDGPMAFGIETFARTASRPFAQIVIPTGQTVHMLGKLSDGDGTAYNVDMILPIPEPATMGLLAAGCVALIIRRRNRR